MDNKNELISNCEDSLLKWLEDNDLPFTVEGGRVLVSDLIADQILVLRHTGYIGFDIEIK